MTMTLNLTHIKTRHWYWSSLFYIQTLSMNRYVLAGSPTVSLKLVEAVTLSSR